MRTTLFAFLLTLLSLAVFAQVPQGISYQAIAFTSAGAPVANGNVGVRISILDGTATGSAVYVERHTKTTNAQGVFNLNIGQGTASTGTFAGISWSGSKFIKVEIDPAGGSSYTSVGTNQLMSVPYALYAGAVAPTNGVGSTTQTTMKTIAGSGLIVVYGGNVAQGYYINSSSASSFGQWASSSANFSGNITGAIASGKTIVVYSNNEAKGFYMNTGSSSSFGQWSSSNVSFSGTIKGAAAGESIVVVYSDNEAKGYYLNTSSSSSFGQWSSSNVSFSGTIRGAVATKNMIVIYSDTEAKGYYLNSSSTSSFGQWSSSNVTFSGTIRGAVASGDAIVVYSDSEAKGYYLNSGSSSSFGQWSSSNVNFTGTVQGAVGTGQ